MRTCVTVLLVNMAATRSMPDRKGVTLFF